MRLALCLLLGGLVLSAAGGCHSSPERVAYRATATTITTARAALDVWFAYVTAEERALVELRGGEPGTYMARRRALLLGEGRVATAWDNYARAQQALVLGAAAWGPGDPPTPSTAAALQSELIALVQSLTR